MDALGNAPLTCTVLGESQGRSMHIEGRIFSREPVEGTYRLVIRKSGPSGTSNISQSGSFVSAPDRTSTAGSATISLEPSAGYEVTMMVEAGGRSFACKNLVGEAL